jgi:hypothetical protein
MGVRTKRTLKNAMFFPALLLPLFKISCQSRYEFR